MLSVSIFPVEIIINILSRLPAKSVGICRCVCKPWRSLLSQPHFIKTHLEFITKLQEPSLILVSDSGSLDFITFMPEPAKKLNFADHPDTWDRIIASCDGLALVLDKEHHMFLINSVTRQIRAVPPPFALDPSSFLIMHGLGYDSVNDDYKIVTLSYRDTDNKRKPDCIEMFVYVYSIKNGTWTKTDQSSPYIHIGRHLTSGVFVNGCIHWIAYAITPFSCVIVAFDLAQEKFYEVPPPNSIGDFEVGSDLVELGGCLCLSWCHTTFDSGTGTGTDVWVMEKYGNKESWTMFTNIDDLEGSEFRPLCMLGQEQMVLLKQQMVRNKLVKHSLLDGSFNDIVVDGISVKFSRVGIFVESLVSPHCSHETS